MKLKKKKILLISPGVSPKTKTPGALRIPEIGLAMIAAFTPEEFEVDIIEEELEEINFDRDCDLVGISCMTANAPRGYEVGREFKKRGKTVVYGGMHPTVMPEEALLSGDAVVVGEAEGAWEKLLEDFVNGNLKTMYRNFQPDVSNYPPPRRDLTKKKGLFDVKPILTTRGCPYNCNFCCVPQFYGRKLRHISPQKVVEDILASQGKYFLFLDDNIIGHPQYAKSLFKEIAHLKIKWVGQASVSFVKDFELMRLARASGCHGLFFGVESVSKTQLSKMRKSLKEVSEIEDAIKKVKDMGIHFHASMVFGFDDDTEAVFDETLEFLLKNKIGTGSYNILTPYPGTEIYKQFKEEGRLITQDWSCYDHNTVVFKPKNMTPMQLAEGHLKMRQELYSFSSIVKRFSGNLSHPLLYLAMNFGNRVANKKLEKNMYRNMEKILHPKAV